MKKLEIIVRTSTFNAVKKALEAIGVHGMTIIEVKGYGRQRGYKEVYRGATLESQFVPKTQINLLVHDEGLPLVLETAISAARTGELGDGKIAVLPVEDVIRIRTGERGDIAI
ncbi:MAG: P-II family nitrogen regulator [Desulfovibrio sp.]|jgi:nitrogen regulatory protein P-II 1|nr:P-II family nitrogen regulator [Desulfovibrio sp.]